jgi:hypothetical protein
MDAAAGAAGATVRRYGVDPALAFDDPALETALAAGDLVVAVAYFGAPVCPRLRALAARRPDVTWLEDRAQALAVADADAVAGAWRLYSPRKLLPVADGGVLVGPVSRLPVPSLAPPPAHHAAAAHARARATTAAQVADAYRLYREIERDHAVADLALSDGTRQRLAGLSVDALADRRRDNFAALDRTLAAHAAPIAGRLRGGPAPFGYPVLVPEGRDAVAARLAAQGLFCAVHWRELGGGAADPVALRLRDGLLTLPVDHRYGGADMEWLADRVLRELA